MTSSTSPCIILSVNLRTTFDKHKHLMNMNSIVKGWWSYASQQGPVMNIIAKKCWPEYTYNMVMLGRCNVAAVEPQIYGVKKNGQHLSCSYQQTNQDWYWEKWRWSQRKAGHQTHTTNTVYQKCQKLRHVLEVSTIKTTHLIVHGNNTLKSL